MDLSPDVARGGTDPDVATRAVDAIDSVIGVVRDKAVRPVVIAARAVVFGLIILVMLLVAAVAAGVGLVRLLNVEVFSGRVWAADALLGVVACAAGALAWSKRRAREVAQ